MTPDRARVWALWGLSRLVVLLLFVTVETGSAFDLKYYAANLDSLGAEGVGGTLREYPVPAFLVLALPYGLLHMVGLSAIYPAVVFALALLLDAWFLHVLVGRARTPGATSAPVWAWLAATPALGALSFARFDLLPGVLVALALLTFVDAPRRAAVLGVLATGVKYSPALVLPGLAAPAASRLRVVVSGAVAGVVLVLVSIAVGGWDRVVSPLSYQGRRGLQIESLAATPAMVRWAFSPHQYDVFYAPSKAWEVRGPGVDALLTASTVATALLLAVLVALWVLAWVRLPDPRTGLTAVVWLTLAAVLAFIAGGKVLSPQYLLWVLPPACAGLELVDAADRRRLGRWTAVLLVTTALTHLIYPVGYNHLLGHDGWSGVMVAVLTVRNLLLAGLCVSALVAAHAAIRRVPRRPRDRAASPASG
ncbi:hypothetical protein [Pimelobacter simplex]|uniref:hypothetical protein n=1 Tax=Nocardioides simplex TaxID=2045 RepID=UPI00214FEE76|nr:hypothetical protein [Pimelobacter simplex]UUW87560.1 hypothetical protein M0M43_17640 [Pimelobacter simplex]UUW97066.1 hypothetical protein M0M48_06290 [Pimelobacter simplex]